MFGMSYYQNYHLGLSFDLTRKVVLRKNCMADMLMEMLVVIHANYFETLD